MVRSRELEGVPRSYPRPAQCRGADTNLAYANPCFRQWRPCSASANDAAAAAFQADNCCACRCYAGSDRGAAHANAGAL